MQDLRVFFNEDGYDQLHKDLEHKKSSRIFVLVDENTQKHCLSSFLTRLQTSIPVEVVEMDQGEESKNIDTCKEIWSVLSDLGADRKSLIINLGGGMVTDLGGFVAATFKRGISCIHVPTTLLAMVDAAIGGKNGVNLDSLKNQIGVIRSPDMVLIDPTFLRTLPPAEMRSGLAEMLKHGLIQDLKYWEKLGDLKSQDIGDLEDLIKTSILIKESIVQKDPHEQHIRKSLNFGHTLGHAIESFCLESPTRKKLLHGEAVAIGIVLAAYLSMKLESFPEHDLARITEVITSMYEHVEFSKEEQEQIIALLKFDKKNEAGKINFVLLRKIGEPVLDRQVPNDDIYDAFSYYSGCQ